MSNPFIDALARKALFTLNPELAHRMGYSSSENGPHSRTDAACGSGLEGELVGSGISQSTGDGGWL